jgi:CO/xanthine dehydrogenase FAD-binding subunit
VVRLGLDHGERGDDGTVAWAAIAVGAVAPVPLRLRQVETALVGLPVSGEAFANAATHSVEGANPLPMTGYKAALLVGTVTEALERATGIAEAMGGAVARRSDLDT